MLFRAIVDDFHSFESWDLRAQRVAALPCIVKEQSLHSLRNKPHTWPRLLTPAVQTLPSLPTRSVWFRPQAAYTNFVSPCAPKSVGLTILGAFSEIYSSPGPEVPRQDDPFLPNSHAFPSMSMATKWQPAHDACTEATLTLLRERSICGSSRSGFLLGRGVVKLQVRRYNWNWNEICSQGFPSFWINRPRTILSS